MKTLKELRAERVAKIEAAKALYDVPEGQDITAEQKTEFDTLMAAADELEETIDRMRRLGVAEASLEAPEQPLVHGASVALPSTLTNNTTNTSTDGTVVIEPAGWKVVKEKVEDDPKRGFKSLADFGLVVHAQGPGEIATDSRLKPLAAISGMGQGQGALGGFAVPPSFATTIWDGVNDGVESLVSMTDNYTVEGESLTFVANAETSRATGSRYGGVRGYWIAEADQLTDSNPKIRQMKLEPQQLAILVKVTEKLLRNNTMALDSYLVQAATSEIQFMTGDAILNGTGAGQPKGILKAAGASFVQQNKETGQGAATIVFKNVSNMWSRLLARARANAVWLYNIEAGPQLEAMYVPAGTGGVPVYMPAGGVSGAQFSTLYGRPLIPCDYCAALGTVGDLVLGDLGYYATGTRGAVEVATSIHLRFDYAEMAFRFIYEVDGQTWLNSEITPFKGSNTLHSFVALQARS